MEELDLGADGAGVRMQFRSAEHEVGTGLADFRAIQQEADVGGLAHFSALREAVSDGERADALTIATVLDALLHVVGCRVVIDHWTSVAVWRTPVRILVQQLNEQKPKSKQQRRCRFDFEIL